MIQFIYNELKPKGLKVRKAKQAILKIFKQSKKTLGDLNYIFCTDEYLLKLNQDYLKHDTYTDIITFDLSSSASIINGEIYISVDRVIENAKTLKIKTEHEFARVVFHGALHLCGYKDKTKSEISQMRLKEEEFLQHYLKP